jgi:hypothetical protein
VSGVLQLIGGQTIVSEAVGCSLAGFSTTGTCRNARLTRLAPILSPNDNIRDECHVDIMVAAGCCQPYNGASFGARGHVHVRS